MPKHALIDATKATKSISHGVATMSKTVAVNA